MLVPSDGSLGGGSMFERVHTVGLAPVALTFPRIDSCSRTVSGVIQLGGLRMKSLGFGVKDAKISVLRQAGTVVTILLETYPIG